MYYLYLVLRRIVDNLFEQVEIHEPSFSCTSHGRAAEAPCVAVICGFDLNAWGKSPYVFIQANRSRQDVVKLTRENFEVVPGLYKLDFAKAVAGFRNPLSNVRLVY